MWTLTLRVPTSPPNQLTLTAGSSKAHSIALPMPQKILQETIRSNFRLAPTIYVLFLGGSSEMWGGQKNKLQIFPCLQYLLDATGSHKYELKVLLQTRRRCCREVKKVLSPANILNLQWLKSAEAKTMVVEGPQYSKNKKEFQYKRKSQME